MNHKFFSRATTIATTALLGMGLSGFTLMGAQSGSNQAASNQSARIQSTLLLSQTTDKSPTDVSPIQGLQINGFQTNGLQTNKIQTSRAQEEAVIATVQAHTLDGRPAATVYLPDIPVITFLGAIASGEDGKGESNLPTSKSLGNESSDPVRQASAMATRLNTLYRTQNQTWDGEKITLHWTGTEKTQNNPQGDRYTIRMDGEDLVTLDENVRLPDTTGNLEADALQVTNRLRRLLGKAAPLQEVAGKPTPKPEVQTLAKPVATEQVRQSLKGMASWYGPGFHGNLTANGEVYNQYAMTAAHRSLPFGTRVRVTNLRNGQSVVVRITDRGPFIRGRIIDVSQGAAQALGMVSSGVAPVQVDVLTP